MISNPSEVTRLADELYRRREEIEDVRHSVELLRGPAQGADAYEVSWRLGRALFFLGQEAPNAAARAFHESGVAACGRAVRARPRRVEGRFWLGVNSALLARRERGLRALRHALRARRELRQAVRLDSSYHHAGPLRVLARLTSKLPPLFGGPRRARALYEQAVALAPANTVTRLYFAELLVESGDFERARHHLETLLNLPHDADWAFESARDRRRAQEMLGRLRAGEVG